MPERELEAPEAGALPAGAESESAIADAAARLGRPLFLTGVMGLWGYLCLTLLYQERFAGIYVGAKLFALVLVGGLVLITFVTSRLDASGALSPARRLEIGGATASILTAVLVADVAYTMYDNVRRAKANAPVSDEARESDAHVWHGELLPRIYYPTTKNFGLYKPNVRLTAHTYGEFYTPAMLASRTLVDSVLEPRQITYTIGPQGLRETAPLNGSGIFALGDSYVLGYATDEGKVWTDKLGEALGEHIYNLGVSSTGPRAHLDLLQYLLAANADSMRVQHLLWMIYEGNDLENSYAEEREIADPAHIGIGGMLEGTAVQSFTSLPRRLKAQSIVGRLRDGNLTFATTDETSLSGQYEIDNVPLPVPLYHSTRWGYRLFNPEDVHRASMPREYVMRHPNRPLLERTMRDMRALSEHHGFRVTVIIAPSDARLYGAAFDRFPAPSAEPYFANYVAELSTAMGFQVTNLVTLLEPFAKTEMLYYRDDHHWNARGNEVAARLIQESLSEREATPPRTTTR